MLWIGNWAYPGLFAQSVVEHEFGHAFGYNNAPESCYSQTIMASPQDPNGAYAETLGSGDLTAIARDF